MQLSENAIIEQRTLLVTPDLVENYGISANSIKSGMMRFRQGKTDRWANDQDRKLGKKSLIEFDSIDWTLAINPPNKEQLLSELTTLHKQEQLLQAKSIPDIWAPFYQALDERYFQSKYNVNSGRANGRNRARELAIGCAIFRMLNTYSTKAKIQAHTGFQSKADLYDAVFEYIKNYDEGGLYEMPSSYRRFKPKFNDFREALKSKDTDPRDTLPSERHGNQIGVKFTHEHRTVFMEVYLDPAKPDKLHAFLDYKSVMQTLYNYSEEQIIGYTRFKQITLEKGMKILAAKCRHGGPYYECFVRPFVIRKPPIYSMSLVAGDGWMPGRTVRYERMVLNEKKIRVRKVFNRAMTVWCWFDWKSKAILNHYIIPNENSEAIRKSFRDILNLHGGCPLSVMLDKSWTKQKDVAAMFETAGVMIQDKRAYNPKSMIAERNFKETNKHHRNVDPYWVDITNNTVEFKHNEEWVRDATPVDEADFREMILRVIERHNHTPLASLDGKTPWQVLEENKNPEMKQFDPLELTYIFGGMRNPKVRNYRFEIDIASRKYEYYIREEDLFTYNKHARKDDKVVAYYDELNMDQVYLYAYDTAEDKSTHRFICAAYDTEEIAINASRYEEELDSKFAAQQSRGAALDQWIDETMAEHKEEMEAIGLSHETVMQASQARFKEAHSNAISQAYRRHVNQRDESEGYPVKAPDKKEPVVSEKEKRKLLEQRMNKETPPDATGGAY